MVCLSIFRKLVARRNKAKVVRLPKFQVSSAGVGKLQLTQRRAVATIWGRKSIYFSVKEGPSVLIPEYFVFGVLCSEF